MYDVERKSYTHTKCQVWKVSHTHTQSVRFGKEVIHTHIVNDVECKSHTHTKCPPKQCPYLHVCVLNALWGGYG